MKNTALWLTIAVITAGIYDFVAVEIGGIDASISMWLASLCPIPSVVFGFGFVCGHVFGYMSLKAAPPPEAGVLSWIKDPTFWKKFWNRGKN